MACTLHCHALFLDVGQMLTSLEIFWTCNSTDIKSYNSIGVRAGEATGVRAPPTFYKFSIGISFLSYKSILLSLYGPPDLNTFLHPCTCVIAQMYYLQARKYNILTVQLGSIYTACTERSLNGTKYSVCAHAYFNMYIHVIELSLHFEND